MGKRYLRVMATLLVTMLSVIAAKAQTPYAVWCESNTTLYFTYSNKTLQAEGSFTPEGASEPIPITKVWTVRLTKNEVLNNRSTQSWIGSYTENATEVYIESSFKDVHPGDLYAWFQGFYKLKTIHGIENLIPAENATMDWMFKYCRSLEGLDLSKLQSSQVTRMEQTFSDCKLDGLDFSKLNTGNVTSMGGMFINCKMTSLNLSQFNTSNVTNMSSMFWGCSNLSNLNLGGLNTEKVIYMNQMFKQCSNLTNLDLSNFNTLKVELMNEMFWGCSNLETLTLSSNFKTDNVNNMMSMFYGCSKLQSLDLTGFNTENVTNMETMFLDCSTLTSLDLTNFNTSNVTSMQGMFQRCTQLKSISFSNSFSCEKVTTMKEMFSGCSSLETLDLKCLNTLALQFTTNMFQNCEKLSSLDISTLNTSNVEIMSGMFGGCKSLGSLDLKNFDTSKAYWMSSMFQDCRNLVSLDVTSFNTENVTDMQNMFYGCENLESINLSKFNTAKVTKMTQMFCGCKKLTRLDLSSFRTGSLQYMTKMFYDCNSLEEINVCNFNTDKIDDLTNVFKLCYSLQTLDLSSFNTSAVTEMDYMFESCSNLVTLYVSDSWTTEKVQSGHGYRMFEGCARIVGGNGTVYCPDYTGESYAHIDGGTENPGYLTEKVTSSVTPSTKQAYAVLGNGTLTFYYDELNNSNTSQTIYDITNGSSTGWFERASDVTSVVFDSSFKDYTGLTTLAGWFSQCVNLASIEGLEYLNTTEVTSMNQMFLNCQNLTSLDVSHFETSKVTDMRAMFSDCMKLKSVVDLSNFDTSNVTDMGSMFKGTRPSEIIFGSKLNTTNLSSYESMFQSYSPRQITFTGDVPSGLNKNIFSGIGSEESTCYLNVPQDFKDSYKEKFDGKTFFGGYFHLDIPKVMYAEYEDNGTLTFYYKEEKTGTNIYPIVAEEGTSSSIGWIESHKASIKKVVFDASFADARPVATDCWFSECSELEEIEGLGYLNTSDVVNMESMFAVCRKLSVLDISNFNTSKVSNMDGMFADCSSLTTIYVGDNWSTSGVTTSDGMFANSTNLVGGRGTAYDSSKTDYTYAHIDEGSSNPGYFTRSGESPYVPVGTKPYAVLSEDNKTLTFYYDTNKETNNGMDVGPFTVDANGVSSGWFNDRESIETVVFNSSFADYHGLTSTSYWFYGLQNLKTITGIENLNTENVTDMQSMFYQCASLTALGLGHFDTSNVYYMDSMFHGCEGLTSLDVSKFTNSKVMYMGGMFMGCNSLTSLDLSNFDTQNVAIMRDMFRSCSSLTTIYVGEKWSVGDNVTSTGMFQGCTSLIGGQGTVYNADHTDHTYAHIDVAGNPGYLTQKSGNPIEPVGSKEPYAVLSNDNKTLTFYYDTNKEANNGMDVGPFTFNNGSVNSGWYNNRSSIQTVVFDESFGNYHDLTSTAFWFVDFYGLQTITGIENLNTENVTSMKEMFYDCALLQSLDVSHFDTGNVEDMGYMFRNCSNLTSLDVRGFKTQKVKYMDGMFELCIKLQSLDLSNFNTENVTILSKMFNRCEALTSIDVSSFDTQKVERMEWMFSGCTGIESLNLSHFNPVGGVMTGMFEGCTSLKEVYLGGTSAEMTSMGSMFNGCSMLKTIYVGDNWNPGSSSYGTDTFKDCGNLVGGKGTVYDESHTGYTYAHIDGGTDNPGYFTGVGQTPTDPEDDIIHFKDEKVKNICVTNWDTNKDGELSYKEAKAVTDLDRKFANHKTITSFDELQYFTGLKALNYQEGGQFELCEKLESITLPEGLEKIGEGTFNYCRVLKSLRIPASVTEMSYLGGWYYGMTEITVAEGNTKYDSRGGCNAVIDKATNTLISGCNATVIPNTVTAIGPFAFNACVTDSIAIPSSVTTIGKGAFSTCLFTGVGLPESISSIGEAAFNGCTAIKHVTSDIAEPFAINDNTFTDDVYSTAILWVPTEKAIGKYKAAAGWEKFQNVRARNYTVEEGSQSDGQEYFRGVVRYNDDNTAEITNVEAATGNVQIPSSVTVNDQQVPVTSIVENAFANNSTVTSVTIPESITSIGDGAFANCENLEYVDLSSSNVTGLTTEDVTSGALSGLNEKTVVVLPEAMSATDAKAVSEAAPNIVYKDGSDYKAEQVKLTDGEAYNAPAAITSIEAASVSYPRTFDRTDVVYSICLPYDQPIGEGLKAYELEEYNSEGQLVFKQASSIEATKPYLIKSSGSVSGLNASNVTMQIADGTTDSNVTGYDFCGSLKRIPNSEASGCLILQSDQKWHPVGEKGIAANRAYLKAKANAARITGTIFIDDATGIKTIDADGTETYYDLQGRRISKPQKGGIYVKNGMKVAVK